MPNVGPKASKLMSSHPLSLDEPVSTNEACQWYMAQSKAKEQEANECKDGKTQKLLRKQADNYDGRADALEQWTKELTPRLQQLGPGDSFRSCQLYGEEDTWYKKYAKLMIEARKFGLGDDPDVRVWFIHQHGFGNRDYLRSARKGWEKGIIPPIPLHDPVYQAIKKYREKGHGWKRVYDFLKRDGLPIKQNSYPSFHRWVYRNNLPIYFSKGKPS